MSLVSFMDGVWVYLEWILTLMGLIFAAFLFLKDRVRRDRFFGFIPTVITVIYDKSEGKVLLTHLNGQVDRWIMPQGRIEGSILSSAREVLFRELNLQRAYKLLGSLYLGRVNLRKEESERLARFMDSSEWTLASRWHGKSYIALFVETRIDPALRELDVEFLYGEVRFETLADAKVLLSTGHSTQKVQAYQKILDALKKELR